MKPINWELVKDRWLLAIAFLLALSGWLTVFYQSPLLKPSVAILIIDFYLFFILLAAAVRSDAQKNNLDKAPDTKNKEQLKRFLVWLFPIRTAGYLMVGLFFIGLVANFAALYLDIAPCGNFHEAFKEPTDALYFSLVTIATVGFGDNYPTGKYEKWLVMWEIASGILLFVGIVSFLISRIVTFESETEMPPVTADDKLAKINGLKAAVDQAATDLKNKIDALAIEEDQKTKPKPESPIPPPAV